MVGVRFLKCVVNAQQVYLPDPTVKGHGLYKGFASCIYRHYLHIKSVL